MNLKEEYDSKKTLLRENIYRLIINFEKETGVKVSSIDTCLSSSSFTLKFYTNIDKYGD